MCGEIDEQVLIGQELQDRAQALAKRLNLPTADAPDAPPQNLADPDSRAAYMEQIFAATLARALAGVAQAEEDETVDALAAQAIALARAAGHLAGQLPAEADLYRAVIESTTEGHAEARRMTAAMAESHHHHHHDDPHGHHH